MYEIWLALNIVYEIALGLWPALLILLGVWLAVLVANRQGLWAVPLTRLLAIAVAVAVAVGAALPSLTLSSFGNFGYWVDWANWLARMQHFDDSLFASTLAGMQNGRKASVKLVMSNRANIKEFITSKSAQKAFWRTQNLNRLLP